MQYVILNINEKLFAELFCNAVAFVMQNYLRKPDDQWLKMQAL